MRLASIAFAFLPFFAAACGADSEFGQRTIDAVTLDVPSGSREPQAAVDGDSVFVVYASEHAIDVVRSDDAGRTFSAPVRVGEPGKLALGMRRGPRVAVARDALVVTAIAGERGGGKDENVFAWRSTDRGARWVGPTRVNDVDGSAREGLHALAVAMEGGVFCAWIDLRDGKGVLYGAGSRDGGATWDSPRVVYRSPEGSICECCHPSLAFDTTGKLYAMWRNQIDGARDMYVADSADGGKTFSQARKVGSGTWKIDSCPMDGGAIAAARPVCVWRREASVYACDLALGLASDLSGTAPDVLPVPVERWLVDGEQPVVAIGASGTYFAWNEGRGGKLWLMQPPSTTPIELDTAAVYGSIAARPSGQGPIVATWETAGGKLRVARVDG